MTVEFELKISRENQQYIEIYTLNTFLLIFPACLIVERIIAICHAGIKLIGGMKE